MYICIYVYMYIYIYIHTLAATRLYIYTHTYMRVIHCASEALQDLIKSLKKHL